MLLNFSFIHTQSQYEDVVSRIKQIQSLKSEFNVDAELERLKNLLKRFELAELVALQRDNLIGKLFREV
ncbi:hypothetical protein [Pontibacter rugosus]|uniref:Uncharacterized protein n=1 Tax=Pontibacter rugosus TaxID=1745966 RepID=A0ABW3SQL5_9BACT